MCVYVCVSIYIEVYIYIYRRKSYRKKLPKWLQNVFWINLKNRHTLRNRLRHKVFITAYIIRLSFLCETWALCVSWMTYEHLYYAPYWSCRSLVGSLVPTMCNRTSCVQVHGCHKAIVAISRRAHCFHDWIYIYIYMYICVCVCVCSSSVQLILLSQITSGKI